MFFNRGVNVFTYGTLTFEEIWRSVVGRTGPSVAASLRGFEAWKIPGESFPGLTPAEGHQVAGRVWQGVTAEELARLDAFESGIYDRERVSVTANDGQTLDCWTYLVRPECRGQLLNEPWDREEFRRRYLATFLSQRR